MEKWGNLSRLKWLMVEQEFQAVKEQLKEQPSMLGQTLHGKSAEEKDTSSFTLCFLMFHFSVCICWCPVCTELSTFLSLQAQAA